MTEAQIQNEVWRDRHTAAQIIMPNFTPRDWWECDIWLVTKAGYVQEYEIKLTASDYAADFGKATKRGRLVHSDKQGSKWHTTTIKKHDRLAQAHETAPKTFSYLMPMDLAEACTVPDYAGLIGLTKRGRWIGFTEIKKAPIINDAKVSDRDLNKARTACYFRMWNDRRRS